MKTRSIPFTCRISLLSCLLLSALSGASQKIDYLHPSIDVLDYRFNVTLNDRNDTIVCDATVHIAVLQNAAGLALDLSSVKANGKGMRVVGVSEKSQPLSYTHSSDVLRISENVKAGERRTIMIRYRGIPADGLVIAKNKFNQRTFFSDNWPNRGHNWLACIDHPSDKAAVVFSVIAPGRYQVVSNGILIEETNLPNDRKLTVWKETANLAVKVMSIGVAEFAMEYAGEVNNASSAKSLNARNPDQGPDGIGDNGAAERTGPTAAAVPVFSWVYPQDRENGFYDYAIATSILPFFIANLGPFPYRKLANVESKTIFGGMENAGAIFYPESSVNGRRDVEKTMAHEIAHQWFGNTVTESDWGHLWLSEGFATYMSLLYLEQRYGLDTLKKELADARMKVIKFSKEQRTPVSDTMTTNYLSLLNPNSYQKGGWVLHMLRRQVGDSLFWKGIRSYYERYAGKNASTDDFRKVMEEVSGKDLQLFFRQWIFTAGHPVLQVSWKYDAAKKQALVTVIQKQAEPFQFPLALQLENAEGTIYKSTVIKNKETTYSIGMDSAPEKFTIDPLMSLLFEAE